MIAIRRDEGDSFRITSGTVVCSDHFLDSDFHFSAAAVLAWTSPAPASGPSKQRKASRFLKNGAVPSVFPFRPRPVARPSPQERLQVREARKQSQVPGVIFGPDDELTHYRKLAASRAEALAAKTRKIKRLQHKIMDLEKRIFRFQNVKDADGGEQLKFLTGLSREYWDVLWSDLQPSAENILSKRSAEKEAQGRLNCPGQGRPSVLTLEDELLMTLMRLRLGRMEQELAYVFGVDKSTVCRIFVKWINFMYLRLGDICLWPSAASVMASMPSCFREAYPSTFAILDATELKCETPSSLPLQSQLYSSYKSHTTKKGLVAIAPNGAFIFVSELYTGSISDRELTKKSGILKLIGTLPPGRLSVMADRGFDIQDLLAKYGVQVWCSVEHPSVPGIFFKPSSTGGCRADSEDCASTHPC